MLGDLGHSVILRCATEASLKSVERDGKMQLRFFLFWCLGGVFKRRQTQIGKQARLFFATNMFNSLNLFQNEFFEEFRCSASALNPASTSSSTTDQSPCFVCRNNRIVGYHGEPLPSLIHRQSA